MVILYTAEMLHRMSEGKEWDKQGCLEGELLWVEESMEGRYKEGMFREPRERVEADNLKLRPQECPHKNEINSAKRQPRN